MTASKMTTQNNVFTAKLTLQTSLAALLTVFGMLDNRSVNMRKKYRKVRQEIKRGLFNSLLQNMAIRVTEERNELFPKPYIEAITAKVKEYAEQFPVNVDKLEIQCSQISDPKQIRLAISAFVLTMKERPDFKAFFEGLIQKPKTEQKRQVYGAHIQHTANPPITPTPIRPSQSLIGQNSGNSVRSSAVIVDIVPVEMVAVARQTLPKPIAMHFPDEEDGAPVSAGHQPLTDGGGSPPAELEEEPVVQLNAQSAAHEASSPVPVFNDWDTTEEEQSDADSNTEEVEESWPPAHVARRSPSMEPIPEVPEELVFDDGTTVDEEKPEELFCPVIPFGEEEVVEEVAPAVQSAMVVHSTKVDKMVVQHRKPTWTVDHLLPRSAFVALGKDIQPPLAVVSLGHITANDLNSFATGFFNLVKREEVSVVLVDERTPDAFLAVQTEGGQLYLALVKNEHPALPAPATTTGTMPLLPAAKWHNQLQHGVSPQLVEDFVAALQQLSIRPEGHGSVFAPSYGGALKKTSGYIGGVPQKHVRFADETTEFVEQFPDKVEAQLAQPASDGETTTFSTFAPLGAGSVHTLPLPTGGGGGDRGGHGGNTQPASFETSTLIAPLGAGSVFGLGSSDGSPDELAGQGDDGEHLVTTGIGDLSPVPEEPCEEMSDGYDSDAEISGDEDDASLALGADAQFLAPALIPPTGGGSVVERAGDEQPSHQPDDDGYSSEDSEGSSTVENWFRDGSVSGDRDGSPTGYGRLEDDDPGVASPVGHLPSAFVPIGWSDRRGSSLVADLMAYGSLQSCASSAIDWERSQMDGFPMSQGLTVGGRWEEGLTLVC